LWWKKWHWNWFFSQFFGFPLPTCHSTVAFQAHIIWGMSNMSVGGSRAETWSHPFEIYPLVTKEVHILKSLFKN
jgi:hypothetical protein